jgi:hypothetical protein
MDVVDQAQKQTDLELSLALKNLKREPALPETGACNYCDALVSKGLFCDADCRDDYEMEQRNK